MSSVGDIEQFVEELTLEGLREAQRSIEAKIEIMESEENGI